MTQLRSETLKLVTLQVTVFHSAMLAYGMLLMGSYWYCFPFLVLTYVFTEMFFRETLSGVDLIRSGIVAFLLFLVAYVLCINTVDFTFDGNAYHLKAIKNIVAGVNLSDSISLENYIRSYPKGSWAVGASLYSISGEINLTKVFNVIIPFCSVMLIYSVLKLWDIRFSDQNYKKLNFSIITIAILIIFSPLNCVQIFSNLNDLAGASSLFFGISLIFLALIGGWNKGFYIIGSYMLGFSALCKFNFLPISIGVFVFMAYKLARMAEYKILIGSLFLYFVLLIDPYLLNFTNHGNIFYPILGAQGSDVVDPVGLVSPWGQNHKDYPEFIRFVQAMFLEYNGNSYKLPWVISFNELKQLGRESSVGSGYGIFSSVLLMLLIVSIALSNIKLKSKALVFAVMLVSIQYPGSSFARYAFLYPGSSLLALYYFSSKEKVLLDIRLFLLLAIFNLSLSLSAGFFNQIVRQQRLEYVINNKPNIVVGDKYFFPNYIERDNFIIDKNRHGLYIINGCYYNSFFGKNVAFLRSCAGERIL
jgi:hypothetical protein